MDYVCRDQTKNANMFTIVWSLERTTAKDQTGNLIRDLATRTNISTLEILKYSLTPESSYLIKFNLYENSNPSNQISYFFNVTIMTS